MDKYAVVLDDEDPTKTASAEKTCPDCGAALSQPKHCPNCGTKPWEKKPTQTEQK